MRILYIARHGGHGNDDEGAIAHALRVLGHEVTCIEEHDDYRARKLRADLCIFHKWYNPVHLKLLSERMRTCFWYFDLVDYPDPTLAVRCAQRMQWMAEITPLVHCGFCTDGDHVADYNAQHPTHPKLHWLPQGADERVVGRDKPTTSGGPRLLFTGTQRGGSDRLEWVRGLQARHGGDFEHVGQGLYGLALRQHIANRAIILAPDAPVTDRYTSNRVYTVLGFGGFLLHPWAEMLGVQYPEGLDWYTSRDMLHRQIEYYLSRPERREEIAEAGYQRTLKEHLYRHRVEQMLAIINRL